ncbi:hypothetical protein DET49_12449 [Salegentibacter sp. 24]|uniref:hypothetical protein n=1 Tax=Salegentibacter sp. 24 TaxID=2183986 RepID=UPI00105E999C|nr:hypothetical protein [Salegentibacter sp. 24]TDN82396.1 hypothetical protein DET49_12449 [Salegentibacter sp. 24]
MKLDKNFNFIFRTIGLAKKTGFILIAGGLLVACNDGDKKAEDSEIDIEPLEVEQDTMSNYSYEANAMADYLTYISGDDEYAEMQEEIDPTIALQKFAAAISERRQVYGLETSQELEAMEDSLSNTSENLNRQLQITVASLKDLQENFYEELSEEVDELKNELQEIDMKSADADKEIRSFFIKTANVMKKMDAPSADAMLSTYPRAIDSVYYEEVSDSLDR